MQQQGGANAYSTNVGGSVSIDNYAAITGVSGFGIGNTGDF